jgi:TatD DNase family protein
MHPHDAQHFTEAVAEELKSLAAHDCVVAWGEIGLDFFYDNSPRDVQRSVLRKQIRIGLELGLPLIIHDRDSEQETWRILVEEGAFDGAGVLYHCFAGDPLHMQEVVEAGGYISLPGSVTWKKAGLAHEVARQAPMDRLLVETDTPFLTPEPLRGRRNEPCHVALVVDQIAELRGIPSAAVASATTENANRVFGLST